MNDRKCLFCDENLIGNRSNEHVLAIWLQRALDIEEKKLSPTHLDSKTGKPKSTRTHSVGNLVEGRVCRTCNNGWMSDLENKARDILLPLIDVDREVISLSQEERFTLARWVSKTAFVLNSSSDYFKNIPPDHFRKIYADPESLPDKVIVLAQQHHGEQDFYWMQGSGWQAEFSKSSGYSQRRVEKMSEDAYKIVFQFRKLLLLIAYWPFDDWVYGLWKGIHLPLWPKSGPAGWYESEREFPWRDSNEAAVYFHMSLKVVEKRVLS